MKYNIATIREKTAYSVAEASALLGVNRKTITRWIREGLSLLDAEKKPIYIMGYDLKAFIKAKREKKSVQLGFNEFYCLACRKAVTAKRGSTKIEKTGKKIGKKNRDQEMICGRCKECGTNVARFF